MRTTATVIGVLLVWGALTAATATVFMWLFNVIARYFEWTQINFWIALAIIILIGFIGNALSKD